MKTIATIVALTAAVLFAGPVSDKCRQDIWVTDGTVNAILPVNGKIYIGGMFRHIGKYTGCVTTVDTLNGSPVTTSFPVIEGIVCAACADGGGGYYIGISGVNRLPGHSKISRISVDGTPDPSFAPGSLSGGDVLELVLDGSTLYAGGSFDSVGNFPRHNLAAFDASSGSLQALDIPVLQEVRALAVSGSTLYLGGYENDTVPGKYLPLLGAFNASTGTRLAWNPVIKGGCVNVIALYGTTVYAAGTFTEIDEAVRNKLAAIDAATGAATEWNPSPNGDVYALAINGTSLFVGGSFTEIAFTERKCIALFDLSKGAGDLATWNPVGGKSVKNITALAIQGTALYFGGLFDTIQYQFRYNMAAVNVATGAILPWKPPINPTISSLVCSGASILVGGNFHLTGVVPRTCLAAFDTVNGNPTDLGPAITEAKPATGMEEVLTLASYGTRLFAGGSFDYVDGEGRQGFAAFDLTNNSLLPWNVQFGGSSDVSIITIAPYTDRIFIGGSFNAVGNDTSPYYSSVNMSTGAAFSIKMPKVNSRVVKCVVGDKKVYIGGEFQAIGDSGYRYLGAVNMYGKVAAWNPAPNDWVKEIVVRRNTVYVGGDFDTIGGTERCRLAAIDTNTGNATAWNPAMIDASDTARKAVNAIAAGNNIVFAGGAFNQTKTTRRNLVALDSATGALIDWDPCPDRKVNALAVYGSTLYAGGSFLNIGGGEGHPYFVAYRMEPPTADSRIYGRASAAGPDIPGFACAGRMVRYAVRSPSRVSLRVFSIDGRRVVTLVDDVLPAGEFRTALPAGAMAPGVYTLVLRANGGEKKAMICLHY